MLICSNCWEINCMCNQRQCVVIDDEIDDIICILNKKGYKTRNCCAGHIRDEYVPMQIYIQFYRKYNFPYVPREFELENHDIDMGVVSLIRFSIDLYFEEQNGFYGYYDKACIGNIELEEKT